MATKKIVPTNPDTKTTAKTDDKATGRTSSRKTAVLSTKHRKTSHAGSGH